MHQDKLQNPLTEELQEENLEMVSGGLELEDVSKRSVRLCSGNTKSAGVIVKMMDPEQNSIVFPEPGTIEDENNKLNALP